MRGEMNRESLDKIIERGILALVLAIMVFAPLAFGAVNAREFLVVQGLTIVISILWGLRLWISPKPQLLWPPICWAVLAFVLYALARYLTADTEYVSRLELLQVLVFAFLFLAVVNNLYRQETVQIISYTLVVVATAAASYAIAQHLTHSNHVWNRISPYPGRSSGPYISPNNLAGFLEMALTLSLALLLVGRMTIIKRILLGYAVLVIGLGLAVTFSRGGWAAAAVGVVALLLVLTTHKNHRWRALSLLTILVAGGIFAGVQFFSKPAGQGSHLFVNEQGGITDLAVRLELWKVAERIWLDHFWWGAGPAHFDSLYREYRPAVTQLQPDRAHNDYLNLLADWGVAGAVIVLAGMFAFAAGLGRTWRHVRRSENDFGSGQSGRFAFYLGASAGLLALAVHSIVDFNLHVPANAITGVILLALLSSHLRFATERYWLKLKTPLKGLATGVITIGVIYLGIQTWRLGHETFWLLQAARYPQLFSAERQAALEKAFAAEPENGQTAFEIGEMLRVVSFNGGDDSEAQANEAIDWYSRVIKLDPHYGYAYLRTGMCLDWLGKHAEAEPYISEAERHDPNGFFTVANIGWHYVQTGDYAAAREWFRRSLFLEGGENNTIAHTYLDLVEQKLQDRASGKVALPPGF